MTTLLSTLKQHKPFDTPDDTLEVLIYEMGEIAKCVHHIRNFPQDKIGYKAELKIALADAYAQLTVLAEWNELPMQEIQNLAYIRFLEAMREKFPVKRE